MWEVAWSKKSVKQLEKLDKLIAERIVDKIETIKNDPHAATKRLVNYPYFRLRIGKYRVILDLRRGTTIYVVQIDLRRDDYKALRR